MVRPLKADRDKIALTHVRISLATKRLIDELRLKHGFVTTDQVLRYYLPSNVAENRPIFHTAREIYNHNNNNLTKQQQQQQWQRRPTPEDIANYVKQQPTAQDIYNYTKQQQQPTDIDKMISDTSTEIMKMINKDKQKQSKPKSAYKQSTWQRQRQKFWHLNHNHSYNHNHNHNHK